MSDLPSKLRDRIVEKTHGSLWESITFFKDKCINFKLDIVS